MQLNPESEPIFNVPLCPRLSSLANPRESDSPFVSCYLDVRGGRKACHAFLHRTVAHIRHSLRGLERFEFDSAVEAIYAALESDWNPQAQGMIIFARGVSNDRHLDVLHSESPVDNRLVRYPTPEILPLIALHQREPAFHLLLVGRDRMRLYERLSGSVTRLHPLDEAPRTRGSDRLTAHHHDDDPICGPLDPTHETLWRLHKALNASCSPLLIAGDAETLSGAADWLPQWAVERLIGSLLVSPGDEPDALLNAARDRIRAICCAESNRLVERLVERAAIQDAAVLGYRSTLNAIRYGEATTLAIADWDRPGVGLPWEDAIAICYEALRSGVHVVLSDSAPLREAGGVGCLLNRESDRASTSNAGGRIGIRRVA